MNLLFATPLVENSLADWSGLYHFYQDNRNADAQVLR